MTNNRTAGDHAPRDTTAQPAPGAGPATPAKAGKKPKATGAAGKSRARWKAASRQGARAWRGAPAAPAGTADKVTAPRPGIPQRVVRVGSPASLLAFVPQTAGVRASRQHRRDGGGAAARAGAAHAAVRLARRLRCRERRCDRPAPAEHPDGAGAQGRRRGRVRGGEHGHPGRGRAARARGQDRLPADGASCARKAGATGPTCAPSLPAARPTACPTTWPAIR